MSWLTQISILFKNWLQPLFLNQLKGYGLCHSTLLLHEWPGLLCVELHHVGDPLCPLSWALGQPTPHRVMVSWIRKGQKGSRRENNCFKATLAMPPVLNAFERALWAITRGASSWHPVKGKMFYANGDSLFREIIALSWFHSRVQLDKVYL